MDQSRPIEHLLEEHQKRRFNSLNLIVSENRMSERARRAYMNDIQGRYHVEFYAGTDHVQELIRVVTELTKQCYKAKYATVAPISGNVALIAAVLGCSKHGDKVGKMPVLLTGGGYPFAYEKFGRQPVELVFDRDTWQLDLEKSLAVIRREKPSFVVIGASMILFSVPIKEIAEAVHEYGGIVCYDGSHTMALIAGGEYQDPLNEGADLLLGSTHKTFPGPQGGLIATNNKEIMQAIEGFIDYKPLDGKIGVIDSPHPARLAALGIVIEETDWTQLARQIVRNARTIANTLRQEGIRIRGQDGGYEELTYCHQVLPLMTEDKPEMCVIRDHMIKNRVLSDGFLRVGSGEIARLGFKDEECKSVGLILSRLLRCEPLNDDLQDRLNHLIADYQNIVL